MAIAQMTKIMIVCHRSQAAELLEDLQSSGVCQILNAEEAMVSKEYPDLGVAGERPRQIEHTLGEVTKSISFLKDYAELPKGLSAALAPRKIISKQEYEKLTEDQSILEISAQAVSLQQSIERVKSEIENLQGHLRYLQPWAPLDIPVEELKSLSKSNCFAGLIASNKLEDIQSKLNELGAIIEQVNTSGTRSACIIVCLNENAGELQKLLRSVDFETVSFESMTGTISQLQQETQSQLEEKNKELEHLKQQAAALAKDYFKLTAVHDYYVNLLQKEQTHSDCPATQQTVIFEGWTRQKDYNKLINIVSKFDASQISEIPPAEGEETPVDIDNKGLVKPFEFITRLYGMPHPTSVDPTVFLAPFFAIFFGLCITDAGYGIILAVLLYWLMKKLQAGKAAVFMFFLCAIMTIIAGALTGSWFADAAQSLIPADSSLHEKINSMRTSIMLFDPMSQPTVFFGLALAMGYIQIMFGLLIAMFNNLSQRNYIAAIFDQVSWLIFLNALALLGASKAGVIPAAIGSAMIPLIIILAILILFCSERKGGWGGRIGMGAFALFGTVFYVGDMLSYVRLMALGMVSAGFGMAINVLVKLCAEVPYAGFILAPLMFIAGHLFNLALSLLSAFVHSLRLQFVEFFPKFLVGGGRDFKPLTKKYNYIEVN